MNRLLELLETTKISYATYIYFNHTQPRVEKFRHYCIDEINSMAERSAGNLASFRDWQPKRS